MISAIQPPCASALAEDEDLFKRCDSVIGFIVRLEAPIEIDPMFTGPIYAKLLSSATIGPGDSCCFENVNEVTRPGWECELLFWQSDQSLDLLTAREKDLKGEAYLIPCWRLTCPWKNLEKETIERPLLFLYRFVRVDTYYVPTDSSFVFRQVKSTFWVCGQILQYFPRWSKILITKDNNVLEPDCEYLCSVRVRRAEGGKINVCIPLSVARTSLISLDEFVMGCLDGTPVANDFALQALDFGRKWRSFYLDENWWNLQLQQSATLHFDSAAIDISQEAIEMFDVFGRRVYIDPLRYIRVNRTSKNPWESDADNVDQYGRTVTEQVAANQLYLEDSDTKLGLISDLESECLSPSWPQTDSASRGSIAAQIDMNTDIINRICETLDKMAFAQAAQAEQLSRLSEQIGLVESPERHEQTYEGQFASTYQRSRNSLGHGVQERLQYCRRSPPSPYRRKDRSHM